MTTSTITNIGFARSRAADLFSKAPALPLFLMLFFTAPAAAESYTFTKGTGAWSPGFVERTVVVPCHASPVARLSGTRFDHYDSNIPITIEFRAPGVSFASPPTHTRVLT